MSVKRSSFPPARDPVILAGATAGYSPPRIATQRIATLRIASSFPAAICLICGLLSPLSCPGEELPAAIEVGIPDASYPVGYRLPSGEMAGSLVRVLSLLSLSSGIDLQIRGYPWARVQTMVKNGELPAFCALETSDRDAFALFSRNPVVMTPLGIYLRAGDHRFDRAETMDDLKPFHQAAYLGNGFVKQNFREDEVLWARTYDDVLKMLVAGRADFMFGDAYSLPQRLAAAGLEGRIVFREIRLGVDMEYRFAIRRDARDAEKIIARIDKALAQIRKEPGFSEAAAPYR